MGNWDMRAISLPGGSGAAGWWLLLASVLLLVGQPLLHARCAPVLHKFEAVAQPALQSTVQRGEGRETPYRVTFDELRFKAANKELIASISAIGYLVESDNEETRPVMFVFNGGPGASAVLQVEGLGPRLRVGERGHRRLVANPDSILDLTDLVFIDPPGTGFSVAPATPTDECIFWSDHGDAKTVAMMVRHWLKEHGRKQAPLYFAGESYGGYRLALMARYLEDLDPAGVLLISPLLDATASASSPLNDLAAIARLPSLAVAATHHGQGVLAGHPVAEVFAEARTYAIGPYARALLQGSSLPDATRKRMASHLATRFGLPRELLTLTHLRPTVEQFRQSLLAAKGLQIGRLDSRVTAPKPEGPGNGRPSAVNDPVLGLGDRNQITSPVMAKYLRSLFGQQLKGDYISLDIGIALSWVFSPDDGKGEHKVGSAMRFNPTPYFERWAADNPNFHILVLAGYYDLAVPALGAWYALHHTTIDPVAIDVRVLPTGHAVFGDRAMLDQLHGVLEEFMK